MDGSVQWSQVQLDNRTWWKWSVLQMLIYETDSQTRYTCQEFCTLALGIIIVTQTYTPAWDSSFAPSGGMRRVMKTFMSVCTARIQKHWAGQHCCRSPLTTRSWVNVWKRIRLHDRCQWLVSLTESDDYYTHTDMTSGQATMRMRVSRHSVWRIHWTPSGMQQK